MKTTIDIPEALDKRAKIRAVERGQILKQIVLTSMERRRVAGAGMGRVMGNPACSLPRSNP